MEHKFEPFERVLVRDMVGGQWKCGIFSHIDASIEAMFVCLASCYRYCIPYAGNEHLLGTTNSPEPKHEYKWGDKVEVSPNGSTWVKALYYKAEEDTPLGAGAPHQHRVVGYNGAYGNLYDFVFHDKDIRPLKED